MKGHTTIHPVMQKREQLNACLVGSLFLSASVAVAADCDSDSSSEDFFQNATAQIVEECIQKGQIDINRRDDEYDGTPLHWAAANNPEPAVISALLEAGADINGRDEEGGTPLHAAAAFNPEPAVISTLLEAGADINSRTENGSTPLHAAALNNPEPAVISALLEAGADINSRTEGGGTPLHAAALNNPASAVISALLEAGAYINSRAEGGITPLHAAAFNNPAPAVISALLEAGADINSRTKDGSTPLHAAALNNPEPAVISALLEAGADPDLVTNEDKIAWDYIQKNPKLKNTDAYQQLNNLRYQYMLLSLSTIWWIIFVAWQFTLWATCTLINTYGLYRPVLPIMLCTIGGAILGASIPFVHDLHWSWSVMFGLLGFYSLTLFKGLGILVWIKWAILLWWFLF